MLVECRFSRTCCTVDCLWHVTLQIHELVRFPNRWVCSNSPHVRHQVLLQQNRWHVRWYWPRDVPQQHWRSSPTDSSVCYTRTLVSFSLHLEFASGSWINSTCLESFSVLNYLCGGRSSRSLIDCGTSKVDSKFRERNDSRSVQRCVDSAILTSGMEVLSIVSISSLGLRWLEDSLQFQNHNRAKQLNSFDVSSKWLRQHSLCTLDPRKCRKQLLFAH